MNVRAPEASRPDGRPQVITQPSPLEVRGVRQPGETRSYASVLASVRHGLREGERLIVVTGESGTGKTMLCRALIEDAEPLTRTSVMLQPPATTEDLLAHFLRDMGVLDSGTSSVLMTRKSLVFALERFLQSLIPVGGRAVLVVDEAQLLTPLVLEQLRLALNFETADSALLQVVLVGQPELDTLLQWPELRRVCQRVSRRCELTGLEADEYAGYIEECLDRRSPGTLVRFTPAAARVLMTASQGVPRLAERLCVHALELAAVENARRIEPRGVYTAAKRLGLPAGVATRLNARKAGAAAAVVIGASLMAGGAWGWANRRPPDALPAGQASAIPAVAAAAAVPSTAGLATATLETGRSLTVTVATFRTESRARAVVAQLVDEGFPAFPRSKGEAGPYQVIVGPYASSEEAVAAQKSLAAKGVTGTEVRIETADLSRSAWQ